MSRSRDDPPNKTDLSVLQIQAVQISATDLRSASFRHQASSRRWRAIVAAPSGAFSKYPSIGAAWRSARLIASPAERAIAQDVVERLGRGVGLGQHCRDLRLVRDLSALR